LLEICKKEMSLILSSNDITRGLKIIYVASIGTYTGATLYSMLSVQPTLIEEQNVPVAARVRWSFVIFFSLKTILT